MDKTFSVVRRGILPLDLDEPASSADPTAAKPSPRPSASRHIRLPSALPSFLSKKHPPKDPDTVPKTTSFHDKPDDSGEPEFHPPDILCDFGKIFEDVDKYILTLWSPHLEIDETAVESEKTEEKDKTDDRSESEKAPAAKEEVPECVTKFLDLVEGIVIGRYDSRDGRCRWNEVPEGDMLLLESIDRISKMVTVLTESKSSLNLPKLFSRVGRIQHIAMSFLGEQLRSLLEDSRTLPDPKEKEPTEESKTDPQPERYPEYDDVVVWCIKSIATRMLYAGYVAECCHVYAIARQNAFDDSVYKAMGFERISIDDTQKLTWDALEQNISTWTRTCHQCATVYFPGELKLIREIFADEYPEITGCLYRNLIRTVLLHLLNFAEAVALVKRSTEKLFKILDMYETIRDTMSTDSLFPCDNTEDLKREAALAQTRLGETAVAIFSELETSIRSETGKTPVPGGAVHPLTRYTMNYLNYACQYKETLEHVFKHHSKFDSTTTEPVTNPAEPEENRTPFSIEIIRVMDMLDANLETKSKLYKDIALSSIFMMNNGRYILQKIKKSPEIHQLMGDTWSRKRSTNLRNYHKMYQRETWNKLLGYLGHEGLASGGKVVKPALKERFKSFNTLFDEIHKTQSTWVVSDEQLQTELRISISSLVIPAYRSFVGRFGQYIEPGRQAEKYVKYQPEQVEECIDDLFEGSGRRK